MIVRVPQSETPHPGFEPFPHNALDRSIPARFDEICQRFAEKTAVRTRTCSWNYGELNARANFVAQALARLPLIPRLPIALMFEHEAAGIAAVVGVLKAGHFYCALDPAASMEHNGIILESLKPGALLSDDTNFDQCQKLASGKIPTLDTTSCAGTDRGDFPPEMVPHAFAYVFFTSGTTDKPKGVMDSHRNVLHNVLRYTNNLQISSCDRLTLLQKLSFSGSVSSLFCALLNGATVCPLDIGREGPVALADWLEQQEITIYHSVPSIFRLIASEGHRFPQMRIVRLEGDQSTVADAALFQKHFSSSCVLVNGLGATECGIVPQFFFDAESALPSDSLPIGHAIEEMEVSVIDDEGRKTQPGETGEIAVQSRYLAVGYWQQPEKTAMAFTPAPDDPASRIYRTGDLGRMDESGCLEYAGRKDFQEKVGGFRVDLTKIESVMLQIEGVAEAVGAIKPGRSGDNQVVIYYTLVPGAKADPDQVRQHLRFRIDAASMPSALVKLDRLPVNSNGKVDRRALPPPYRKRMIATPLIPPRNQNERKLLEVWKKILELDDLGTEDSFLELGGDSLQVMRMLSRLRDLWGIDVSIVEFFGTPTIAGLAKVLNRHESTTFSF